MSDRLSFVLLQLFLIFSNAFDFPYKKGTQMDVFEMCDNLKQPYLTGNFNITRTKKGSIVNSVINVTKNHPLGVKGIGELQRCKSKENLDTCEMYHKVKIDACLAWSLSNQMWSSFIDSVKPPVICPLQKGIYIQKNATFDPALFSVFPIDQWYWKLKMKMVTKHDQLLWAVCVNCFVIKYRD